MNDEDFDIESLSRFLEQNNEAKWFASNELKLAIKQGQAAEVLGQLRGKKRHRHPPPVCANGHADKSCSKYGPHALCTFGFEPGNQCVCIHWETK